MANTTRSNIFDRHRHDFVNADSAYTMTVYDRTVLADATDGAFAVTLPAANAVSPGTEVVVKKSDASANAVTITRAGSDTIDGATTSALAAQYNSKRLRSDGTSKWMVC